MAETANEEDAAAISEWRTDTDRRIDERNDIDASGWFDLCEQRFLHVRDYYSHVTFLDDGQFFGASQRGGPNHRGVAEQLCLAFFADKVQVNGIENNLSTRGQRPNAVDVLRRDVIPTKDNRIE